MILKSIFAVFFFVSGIYSQSQGQITTVRSSLKVSGQVKKPLTLSAGDLSKMKHVTAVLKDRNGKTVNYSGVPLQDILGLAGVATGGELRGESLAKYLLVKCADGYEVLFSLAEVDSSFTERVIILADASEGKSLPADRGPFRLIVSGEKKAARSSYQVLEFVVRSASDK